VPTADGEMIFTVRLPWFVTGSTVAVTAFTLMSAFGMLAGMNVFDGNVIVIVSPTATVSIDPVVNFTVYAAAAFTAVGFGVSSVTERSC